MVITDSIDKKPRDLSVLILIIGFVLIIIWFLLFYLVPGTFIILLYIGIGIVLGALLFLTRIQFILWATRKVEKIHK
ncbi:MAG: hypothetical protein BAJALOKI1v1_540006 [Promethearchaeota archaeon]|nr:MAG: hypothetical protein BAJALOKI1v1_540006 [Candidatus Lokiarchaeota archaeon]